MITVKLKGGLGNQMFQYATSRALALRNQTSLALDTRIFEDQSDRVTPRTYALTPFHIDARILKKDERTHISPLRRMWKKLARKIKGRTPDHYSYFDQSIFNAKDGTYLDGYFQNEKYFLDARERLLKEFTLKNPLGEEASRQASDISVAKTSVSLHVRRGDYVSDAHTNAYHGSCGKKYFMEAYAKITALAVDEVSVFIFSDDIEWAKTNLSFPSPTTFVSNPLLVADYEELFLMSLCTHHIIANSTFSWWGAWLGKNEDKIIIAPKKWTSLSTDDTQDIIPKEWIRI